MKLRMVVAVAILISLGCSKKDADRAQFDANEVLRVAVSKSGEIRADGELISLQELDGLLAANAEKDGVVWYYREAGAEGPPPQAIEAITLIAAHERPVRMSSKPDFSDVIDAKGNSVPGEK